MDHSFPHDLLDDPAALAEFQGWSREVYRDFLELQDGRLSADEFDRRYLRERAILILDLTGFTVTAKRLGSLHSLLRIFDAQKVCLPVLRDYRRAEFVRTFADDIVALFPEPAPALDAALEIHERIALFNRSPLSGEDPPECCIGIGYGPVYGIGPNLAMGDEVNRVSKLGEDTARGGETLVTEGVYRALAHRADVDFDVQLSDDRLFPYYHVVRRG